VGHAEEVTTSVHTKRVSASDRGGAVSIAWDYPGRTFLQVRILRSGEGFAGGPEPTPAQVVVYEDVTGSFGEPKPELDADLYYTVFAREPGREWHRWAEFLSARESSPGCLHGWSRLRARARRRRSRLAPLSLLALVATLAAAASLASPAVAEENAAADAGQQAAAAAAADDRVAAVLRAAGDSGDPAVTPWPDGAGFAVHYEWPAERAINVHDVWPLVATGDDGDTPVAPYTQRQLRLRIAELTGLRVDVLGDGGRVVQLMPIDAATRFELLEQTRAPFSWMPWFTSRPWVLVPLFLVVGALVVWRAWLRSRAWNRRNPSMTRHDRQFIGRLTVLLFLVAGFAWQIYEGVIAVTWPTADPTALAAGDLVNLPLLLIPPGLFLAALVLELSWQAHRVAWGLIVVLAAGASAYYLAAAVLRTTTSLNLTFYILLAVLALIAIPRAFSMGKMGWSRSFSARYG